MLLMLVRSKCVAYAPLCPRLLAMQSWLTASMPMPEFYQQLVAGRTPFFAPFVDLFFLTLPLGKKVICEGQELRDQAYIHLCQISFYPGQSYLLNYLR